MKRLRETAVAALVVVTLAIGSGCSFVNESQKQFLSVSELYARSLAECDLSEIGQYCGEDFVETEEEWCDKLSFSQGRYYNGNNSAYAAGKIAEGITYELFPDTAKISENAGSIKCVFSVPDYESATADSNINNINEFYEVLYSFEYVQYQVVLEFSKTEGEWTAVNYNEIMSELYSFTDVEYCYDTAMIDRVTGQSWYYDDYYQSGEYFNTNIIDLDIVVADGTDLSTIYFVIEYDGREIKRESGTFEGILDVNDHHAPTQYCSDGLVLAEGDYTITFYDEYGNVLISDVAHVHVY
jgi:hypothetical protein